MVGASLCLVRRMSVSIWNLQVQACFARDGRFVLSITRGCCCCSVTEADVLMATDGLGPSNAPDDDGLETPEKILSSQLSTGAFCLSTPRPQHSSLSYCLHQTDFQNSEETHEQGPVFKNPLTASSMVVRRLAAKQSLMGVAASTSVKPF